MTLQLALACPPPETDAETHFKLTAVAGTVMQPLKVGELVPTVRFHVRAYAPGVISQVIVATDPPAMAPPGLLAVNGMELGVARKRLTVLRPFWMPGGRTTEGWRGLAAGR